MTDTEKFEEKVGELIGDLRSEHTSRLLGYFKQGFDLENAALRLRLIKNKFTTCPSDYTEVCLKKIDAINLTLDKIAHFNQTLKEECNTSSVSENILCQDKMRRLMNLRAIRAITESEQTWKRFEDRFNGKLDDN